MSTNTAFNIFVRQVESERVASSGEVIDPKDVVFYEVSMSREDSYLVSAFQQGPCKATPGLGSRKPGVQVGVFLRVFTPTFERHPSRTGL